MVLARRDTHEVLKLVDWHLLVFLLRSLWCRRIKRYRFARRNLSASSTTLWLGRDNPGLESGVVFCGGLECFFQCSVCAGGGKWIARFNDPELMWKVLALSTTFAGNLTIVGRLRT
jgi:hypothetical protein